MSSSSPFECTGIDVFVISNQLPIMPEKIGSLRLELISERGLKVWPNVAEPTYLTDWFRCRYIASSTVVREADIEETLKILESKKICWEKIQKLWSKDGQTLYSKDFES